MDRAEAIAERDPGEGSVHRKDYFTRPLTRLSLGFASGLSRPLPTRACHPPGEREGEPASRERQHQTHRRRRPGRGRPLRRARRRGRSAREKPRRHHHPDRQGPRGRRRRQHPLDAVLHAHGRGRPRRAELRARHAGGDAVQGRRGLFRHARRAGARHHAVDRRPRRAVPPAGLLSRQGPAAHPAGRRRRDHPSRADPRRARGRRDVPLRLRGARRCRRETARSPACGSIWRDAARRRRRSWPAAASRPTPR